MATETKKKGRLFDLPETKGSFQLKGMEQYNVYYDDIGGLPSVYRMLDRMISKIENGEVVYEQFQCSRSKR